MNKSRLFFILCLVFILGIGLHAFISPEQRILEPRWWYFLFLGCSLVGIVLYCNPSQPPLKVRGGEVGLCLAMLFLGLFRYAQVLPMVNEQHILSYLGQEVMVSGMVDSLPREREKTTAYVIGLMSLRGHDSARGNFGDSHAPLRSARDDIVVKSKLLLATERFPKYKYGDILSITCTPEALNEYEQYYRREGVTATCAFPKQVMLTGNNGRGTRAVLYKIRETFHTRLRSLFPDPYGGLLSGLLYGDTSGFSKELKENFRIAGISHITALSGYNVTIIAQTLIYLLICFWLTRKQALPIALLLIFGFVILTGAEASVVRAAIMGFLILGSKGIGRRGNMRVALTLAGAIMLAFNPYLLRFDLGFQLSFLATIALIWLADDFAEQTWIRRLPKIFGIREAGAASAAAILFTSPLLFYTTGMLGPLSLLVNILVVPIVPFVMAIGFISVAVDFLFHPLGIVISWITRIPLGYIIGVAKYSSSFGAWHWKINAITAIVIFGIIVLLVWLWKKKLKYVQENTKTI